MTTRAIQAAGAGCLLQNGMAGYDVKSTYAEGSNPRTLARVVGSDGVVLLFTDFSAWDVRVFTLNDDGVAVPKYSLLAQAPGSAIQAIGVFNGEWTYDVVGATFFHTLDLQANPQLKFTGGTSVLIEYLLYSNAWGRIRLSNQVAFESSLSV